ncbi:MAG: histidinol-phosphate transaminase [Nisaea sp.]|jgi:histidinol-phosphate aminotransferase|uniref:histidinol-phosphate transaminase n=1 Tax=Nisaea sp. TaxID=2024842 RepID=UPI001B042E73|nr:histidinol-phosphate transaminase [Nisaea sp.]MBO6562688.1 histidinol-phosphate transaminase [Nisaea sp.]
MAEVSVESTIPKPALRALPDPGRPPIEADVGKGPIRRMNLNESPIQPSPKAIAAMQEACTRVNRYPDPQWRELTAAISGATGIPQHRIVMGNGSDEAIVSAGRLAVSPGDEVVVPMPSFPSYNNAAALNGGTVVTAPVKADGSNDVDALIAACTPKTRIVFAASPNNPTGAILTSAEVARLVAGVPDTALLVLDEAYYEFGIHAGGEDHLKVMETRKGPWAVFRTFSKAYGLAGIRVGYVLAGSDDIAKAFQKVRSVFNVNAVAQAGALAAWHDTAHREMLLEKTRIERERLVAGLTELGAEPFPTVANFVTAKMDRPAADVCSALLEHGVMIGRLMYPGYENYIRVTVGSAEDTDAFLAALKEVLAK